MLRTNLSTRPFYNTRAVRAILVGLTTVVALASLYNGLQLVRLGALQRSLSADAVAAESEATRLTRQATQVRSRIDPAELDQVSAAAGEANAIIDRRAFSWTTLFSRFETALPPEVRITAVQPRREPDGMFAVSIAIESRRIEGVDAFIEALEATGTFKNVLPTEEQTGDDGLIEAVLDGQYLPDPPPVAAHAEAEPTHGPVPPATASTSGGEAAHD